MHKGISQTTNQLEQKIISHEYFKAISAELP